MGLSREQTGAIKETLLSGGYNLLLGAGCNSGGSGRDSYDISSADALRAKLINLKGLKSNSSLSRAYSQLTTEEIREHITTPFSGCTPSPALATIPTFVWRRIYTLNVDDALETAYSRATGAKQRLSPLTHKADYRNPEVGVSLQCVHVHGWVGQPDDGYVFSLTEYSQGMGAGNPWVNVLTQTISSEPFIVAGTSLEEPDFEYFIRARNTHTARRDRGPSFLIEPNPDAGTLRECERHNLILYRGTLESFLDELNDEFPTRPLPLAAPTGLDREQFSTPVSQRELALFAREFKFLSPQSVPDNSDLSFFVGREATLSDLALERDVAREATAPLKRTIAAAVESQSDVHILFVDDVAGGGKSTICRRALYDLACAGQRCFIYSGLGAIDLEIASLVFTRLRDTPIVLFDNCADYVAVIAELYRRTQRADLLFILAERSYRVQHAIASLAIPSFNRFTLSQLRRSEVFQLIEKMDGYGLTSREVPVEDVNQFASETANESIALAVCRIMNDYRPMNRILDSLLQEADSRRLTRYSACALASYCFAPGLRASILTGSFEADGLQDQFYVRDVLPLSYFDRETRDYVIPANPVLGRRILDRLRDSTDDTLFEVYCTLGAALASYVNLDALRRRTPEARLAGRLFDFDDVVSDFIPTFSERFYLRMERYWKWNSRFWEQFALMKLHAFHSGVGPRKDDLIAQAISHAKHAIRVDRNPLALTTLGKVIFEEMRASSGRRDAAFSEGFDYLDEAIRLEGRLGRTAIHPFKLMFSGTMSFLREGGSLSPRQKQRLRALVENSESLFRFDSGLLLDVSNLRPHLS